MGNWNAEQNSMRREMKMRNAAYAQLFIGTKGMLHVHMETVSVLPTVRLFGRITQKG
jgi:hypothetical protein